MIFQIFQPGFQALEIDGAALEKTIESYIELPPLHVFSGFTVCDDNN